MMTRRLLRGIALIVPAVLLCAAEADALRYQVRPDWVFGVGWGVGRGKMDSPTGQDVEWREGASPFIRFGRMLGTHFMVSLNYEGWLIEFGEIPEKQRANLQNLALGISWFPGDPSGPLYGTFLRAGMGMGWAGLGAKEALPGEPQHRGNRIDQWGVGYFGQIGYEFWVSHNVTVGGMVTANYFVLEREIVDTGAFASGALILNRYF